MFLVVGLLNLYLLYRYSNPSIGDVCFVCVQFIWRVYGCLSDAARVRGAWCVRACCRRFAFRGLREGGGTNLVMQLRLRPPLGSALRA
jgi:hypothetical protein